MSRFLKGLIRYFPKSLIYQETLDTSSFKIGTIYCPYAMEDTIEFIITEDRYALMYKAFSDFANLVACVPISENLDLRIFSNSTYAIHHIEYGNVETGKVSNLGYIIPSDVIYVGFEKTYTKNIFSFVALGSIPYSKSLKSIFIKGNWREVEECVPCMSMSVYKNLVKSSASFVVNYKSTGLHAYTERKTK